MKWAPTRQRPFDEDIIICLAPELIFLYLSTKELSVNRKNSLVPTLAGPTWLYPLALLHFNNRIYFSQIYTSGNACVPFHRYHQNPTEYILHHENLKILGPPHPFFSLLLTPFHLVSQKRVPPTLSYMMSFTNVPFLRFHKKYYSI